MTAFTAGREAAQERLRLITEKIDEQARLNKALRLSRVPRVVARVLRELDRAGLHEEFMVIGTQALYAYEAAGGAHFLLELLASGDVNLLYDARKKLVVVSEKIDGNGLLGLFPYVCPIRARLLCTRHGYRVCQRARHLKSLVI